VILASRRRSPSWTPATPGGLAFWGDSSDLSTLFQDDARTMQVTAAGQSVGNWGDKSGSSHHLGQSTSGLRPTYTATGGAGGGPGVQTSAGLFLKSASFSMSDCTFVVIAKSTSGFLVTHYDAGANGVYCFNPSGYTAYASRTGSPTTATINAPELWSADFAVYTVRVDGGAPLLSLYRGGSLIASTAATIGTTPQSVPLTINTDANGNYGGSTVYSEILVYDHALSSTERAAAESYLATRWGL
jgi:hypothetical protein